MLQLLSRSLVAFCDAYGAEVRAWSGPSTFVLASTGIWGDWEKCVTQRVPAESTSHVV